MKCKIFILSFLLTINLSCEDDSLNEHDKFLKLVYSDYVVPEGFYYEQIDLNYFNIRYEDSYFISNGLKLYQLSTDSFNQAKIYSDSGSGRLKKFIISHTETSKYFEFRRIDSLYPEYITISRIHKLSYLDRSMYDFYKPDSIIGLIKLFPITSTNVKEVIQYLWFIDNYNNEYVKILCDSIHTNENTIDYTLTELRLLFGDFGMCDKIKIFRVTYYVDKINGLIKREKTLVDSLYGKCH